MFDLISIKEDIQNIAEAIALALKVDVTIVDYNLIRIAGTGIYNESLLKNVDKSSAFGYSLKEKKSFIIENPKIDSICQNCGSKAFCKEFAEVCSPIYYDEEILGVIGLVALCAKQKQELISNKKELMVFLKKMGELISSKIKALKQADELEREKNKLEILLNTIDKAVISTNKDGMIEKFNDKFIKMFKISDKNNLDNKYIYEILSFLEKENIYNKEIERKYFYNKNKGYLNGIYTKRPLVFNNILYGFVFDFIDSSSAIKDFNEITLTDQNIKFEDIIGTSDSLNQIKNRALIASKSNSTLLINGESGTGKELFARAIHNASNRKNEAFITVNCGAIPDNLLESELFGYEEGAFTGAKKAGKLGKFEIANNGTIFLDEIGDMNLHLQVKLLRVIQEREIEKIGSNQKIKIDVRIICATNKNLEEMVLKNEFREDLYYRLNVIPLLIPSLRERKDDIILLIDYFIKKHGEFINKDIIGFDDESKIFLKNYSWPGNVRELENTVEYCLNMTNDSIIKLKDLPSRLLNKKISKIEEKDSKIQPIKELEKQEIIKALKQFKGVKNNKEIICKELQISRASLYRKIKEYEIDIVDI
ncbi:MAG: sigma 54-interacting transcriptional regulator [Peptostreptococcaceae bacterium]|jgi:transcriptional regulator with PAS, ATPase and Fis domain|nr:sigma 54-interacting transcriptional regulator [Peptostreptococcaceae bacterium]